MAFFKKNNQFIEVINKINVIENKMDILNNKFESVTFMDGCCDCKKREVKIYTDLQEFLDDRLLKIKDSLIQNIELLSSSHVHKDNLSSSSVKSLDLNDNDNGNENNNENDNSSSSSSSDSNINTPLTINEIEDKIKLVIEDVYNKQRDELISTLKKCCETQSSKTDLFNMFHSMNQNINNILVQTKDEITHNIIEHSKSSDLSLRNDLQTFLVGLQKEVGINIQQSSTTCIQKIDGYQDEINRRIEDLKKILSNITSSVNGFYYENEAVKHQLSLEDDIRKYHDEIQNIKILATNMKINIESMLENYDFEN